jgi:hypothetical protein
LGTGHGKGLRAAGKLPTIPRSLRTDWSARWTSYSKAVTWPLRATAAATQAEEPRTTMMMGIGLALGTLGAILRFAIQSSGDEFDLQKVGLILMIVGCIAFITGVGLEFMKRRAAIPPMAPMMHQPPVSGMPQHPPAGYPPVPPQHPPASYPPQSPVQPPLQPPMQPH